MSLVSTALWQRAEQARPSLPPSNKQPRSKLRGIELKEIKSEPSAGSRHHLSTMEASGRQSKERSDVI